jgi:ribonuclease HII
MAVKFDPGLLPVEPDLSFEISLWSSGIENVAGIDEAGRGALAGPVAAAALILPPDPGVVRALAGVRDSKQMTPRQRESRADRIREVALAWGIGLASAEEIDALGILPATRLAAQRAVEALSVLPNHLLLDYLFLPEIPISQTSLIKGDCRSLSIAAASVLAKTARDALMRGLEVSYPGYDFAIHKGYGTADHRLALERLGPSPIHRRTFKLKVGNRERHPG